MADRVFSAGHSFFFFLLPFPSVRVCALCDYATAWCHSLHFAVCFTVSITGFTMSNISKKRKFVADGVFFAEINEFFMRELGEDGYSGCEVRVTPVRTEIIIR